MSQVLYRQYRPQKFEQVLGQSAVTTTLKNAVRDGKAAHAYLFTGPRGVGKTSVARILAKALDCLKNNNLSPSAKGGGTLPSDPSLSASGGHLPQRGRATMKEALGESDKVGASPRFSGEPCDECENCAAIKDGHFLDLIEIDAASHTGVDNIREIIEHVKFTPAAGKFKIIVVDEVHMLSKGAFNALLKTLEEPPAHVVFVLATTEINKVPATIISRTQRFEFKRLSPGDIIKQLEQVAGDQKLSIPDEVFRLIAHAAEGGLRDALSLFDQLLSFTGGKVSLEQAQEVLGLTPFSLNQDLYELLAEKKLAEAIAFVKKLGNEGRDIMQFGNSFLLYLDLVFSCTVRGPSAFETGLLADDQAILVKHAKILTIKELARLLEIFLAAVQKIRYSPLPELPLELAAVEFIYEGEESGVNARKGGVRTAVSAPSAQDSEEQPLAEKPKIAESKGGSDMMMEICGNWNGFLTKLRDYNHSLISSLKLARIVSCDGIALVLAFPYRFHKDAVEQIKNKIVIEKVLSDVFGRPLRLECKMNHEVDDPVPIDEEKRDDPSGLLKEALKVFGASS